MPRGVGEGAAALVYPSGCREVKEDLSPDELIRRLKVRTMFLDFLIKSVYHFVSCVFQKDNYVDFFKEQKLCNFY
jgi:hypothetical protein